MAKPVLYIATSRWSCGCTLEHEVKRAERKLADYLTPRQVERCEVCHKAASRIGRVTMRKETIGAPAQANPADYPRSGDWLVGPPPHPGRWWIADGRVPAIIVLALQPVGGDLRYYRDGKRVTKPRPVMHCPEKVSP